MINIGERFKLLRQTLELTQKDFSEKVLVSPSYISKIESGKEEPSEIFVKMVSLEFNVSFLWLRDGEGEMKLSKEDFDWFGISYVDEYKKQVSENLSEFYNIIKSLNLRTYLDLATLISSLTKIISVDMETDARKSLFIQEVTKVILNLEEIVIKCAETDKNDSVDVYRTTNFIGKNRIWFEDNISDIVELFFGKPLS